MFRQLAAPFLVAALLIIPAAANAATAFVTPVGIIGPGADAIDPAELSTPQATHRAVGFSGPVPPLSTAPLPEPQSWAMMVVGFALLGARRRRLGASPRA